MPTVEKSGDGSVPDDVFNALVDRVAALEGGGSGAFTTDQESFVPATVTPPTTVKTSTIPAGTWMVAASITFQPPGTPSQQHTFYFSPPESGTFQTSEWAGVAVQAKPSTAFIICRLILATEQDLDVNTDFEGTPQDIDIQFGKIMWWGQAAQA